MSSEAGEAAGADAPAGERAPGAGPSLAQSLRPRGPVQLRITHYERTGATMIVLAGELDILTAPRFSAYVDELVRRRVGEVMVDVTEVSFVDSAGLQILLSAQRRLTRRGRWLALICPPGPVRRVIELARLTEALGVRASFEEYERRRGDDAA